MKTIPKQEKLHARLTEYYNALATIDTLSDKEAEKLYKRIDRTIQRLKQEEEESREWVKLLASSSDELEARVKDTKNSEKKVLGLSRAPANGTIDYRENITHHFARGTNGYKLFIIFFVGSIAGFVAESIWCIMRHGYYESRQGLVYGPFSPIYGIGAVCLTAALYQYRNRSASYSFWGGLICALLFSCHILVIEKVSKDSDGVELSMFQFFFGGLMCLIGMLIFERPDLSSIKEAALPLAYAGFLSCGVAYTLQTVAQKYVQASKATLALSLESVWAAIGGALILSERLSLNELIGCALVFLAVLLAQIDIRRPNTSSQSD